jgi:hypothetical protein
MNATARDSRPAWAQRTPASGAQFQFISDLAKERGIDITQHFSRPSTVQEARNIIDWLKGQPLPASPQAKLPANIDKNGKARPTYYAIDFEGQLRFFRVKAGRKPGMYFVDEQASDEFYPVRQGARRGGILGTIMRDPQAAMQRYGQEIGRCSRCGRTLTDPVSRDYGIGPDCRNK